MKPVAVLYATREGKPEKSPSALQVISPKSVTSQRH